MDGDEELDWEAILAQMDAGDGELDWDAIGARLDAFDLEDAEEVAAPASRNGRRRRDGTNDQQRQGQEEQVLSPSFSNFSFDVYCCSKILEF